MYLSLVQCVLCVSMIVAPALCVDDKSPVQIDPYLMLPLPISIEELPQLEQKLMLSDAQRAILDSLFEDFQQSLVALEPTIRELNRREQYRRSTDELVDGEWVERSMQLTPQEHFDRAASIQKEARRIESELRRIEDEFFAGLEVVLAEPQQERIYEARRNRKRIAYQVRTEALPGAQADFIEILQMLDVRYEDDEVLRELLGAYEERLVQLLQLRHGVQSRTHLGDLKWLATYVGSGNIVQQAIDKRGRIRGRQIRIEAAIRRLNNSTLEALSFVLDEHTANDVLDAYYRISHPRIADEPCVAATRSVLDDALARLHPADDVQQAEEMELADDIAAEMNYLRERFLSVHRRLQRRLSDLDFDHTESFYRTLSGRAEDFASYQAGIEEIKTEIRDLCKETTSRVDQLLVLLDRAQ